MSREVVVCDIKFEIFQIDVLGTSIENVFKKYSKGYKNTTIGEYIYSQKQCNNSDYLNPLNKYGDRVFCKFKISESHNILKKRGLYCYFVDGQVKYLGKCTSNFGTRINAGYGNISPKNCFKGGQPTNCHVNSEINQALSRGQCIEIGIWVAQDEDSNPSISGMEKSAITNLIGKLSLWNIQTK